MYNFFAVTALLVLGYFVYRHRIKHWWEHRTFMKNALRPVITLCTRESALGIGPYHLRRTAISKTGKNFKSHLLREDITTKKVPYESLTLCSQKLFGGKDLKIVSLEDLYAMWMTRDDPDNDEPTTCHNCLSLLKDEFMILDPNRDKFFKMS